MIWVGHLLLCPLSKGSCCTYRIYRTCSEACSPLLSCSLRPWGPFLPCLSVSASLTCRHVTKATVLSYQCCKSIIGRIKQALVFGHSEKKQQESNFLFLLPDHLSGLHHYLGRNKNEVMQFKGVFLGTSVIQSISVGKGQRTHCSIIQLKYFSPNSEARYMLFLQII